MHELSIALSLVDCICEELPRLGEPIRIRCVHVRVGALSGVAPEALAFAFDVAAEDSAIAGARLAIDAAEGRELELIGVEIVDDADDAADRRSP